MAATKAAASATAAAEQCLHRRLLVLARLRCCCCPTAPCQHRLLSLIASRIHCSSRACQVPPVCSSVSRRASIAHTRSSTAFASLTAAFPAVSASASASASASILAVLCCRCSNWSPSLLPSPSASNRSRSDLTWHSDAASSSAAVATTTPASNTPPSRSQKRSLHASMPAVVATAPRSALLPKHTGERADNRHGRVQCKHTDPDSCHSCLRVRVTVHVGFRARSKPRCKRVDSR
ncbi:hypothetical protein BC831DRAFT_259863 [Entophlyctis helioformis]|nr:hypothetical protein BC831DRAFT_259863 [Entophlyctis helioformis]